MPSNDGMSKLSFDSVVQAVLDGRCSVETVEGVEPWPTGVQVGCDVVSILMHRDVPGAVALFGEIGGATVLTGAFSSKLRDFIAVRHARHFRFDSVRAPDAAVRFLFKCIAEMLDSRRENENFRFVCGADGADLLASLRAISRASEMLH